MLFSLRTRVTARLGGRLFLSAAMSWSAAASATAATDRSILYPIVSNGSSLDHSAKITNFVAFRHSTLNDIEGAWEILDTTRSFDDYRYAIITKDHRIAEVNSKTKIKGVKSSTLMTLVKEGKFANGSVTQWRSWEEVPNRGGFAMRVSEAPAPGSAYYAFNTATQSGIAKFGPDRIGVSLGDLIMTQFYPAMHSLNPPPAREYRLRRVPK